VRPGSCRDARLVGGCNGVASSAALTTGASGDGPRQLHAVDEVEGGCDGESEVSESWCGSRTLQPFEAQEARACDARSAVSCASTRLSYL